MSSWRRRSGAPPAMREHLAHEVDPGHHLGHRMLDLDARVHLDEEEVARLVVVEIFEGSGAAIADRFRQRAPPRRRASRRSGVEDRRRALPPRPSAGGAAASIRARRDGRRRRRRRGSAPRCAGRARPASRYRGRRRRRRPWPRRCACGISRSNSARSWATRMPRPPPPAAALIITGKPVRSTAFRASPSVDHPVAAGHGRHAGPCRRLPRGDLVAHQADGGAVRADEDEARRLDRVGEVGVLGQETVAGMDGVGARSRARQRGSPRC